MLSMIVVAAVWFSPLCFVGGEVHAYENNAPSCEIDGVGYLPDTVVRVDLAGSENDMLAALDGMSAVEVDRTVLDDLVIVYAYSPRVCAETFELSSGRRYNVMAAYRSGHIAIGTPVLEGSY